MGFDMPLHSFSTPWPRKWWVLLLAALPVALALARVLHPGPLVQLSVDLVPGPNGETVVKLALFTCTGTATSH